MSLIWTKTSSEEFGAPVKLFRFGVAYRSQIFRFCREFGLYGERIESRQATGKIGLDVTLITCRHKRPLSAAIQMNEVSRKDSSSSREIQPLPSDLGAIGFNPKVSTSQHALHSFIPTSFKRIEQQAYTHHCLRTLKAVVLFSRSADDKMNTKAVVKGLEAFTR